MIDPSKLFEEIAKANFNPSLSSMMETKDKRGLIESLIKVRAQLDMVIRALEGDKKALGEAKKTLEGF